MTGERVCVVIVNWNRREDTVTCLASLASVRRENVDVVVVDNASTDGSVDRIRKAFPDVHVLQMAQNGGFASGANAGVRWGWDRAAEYFWLLNNDTTVDPGALDALLVAMRRDASVAAAASVVYAMETPSKVLTWGGGFVDTWFGTTRVAKRPVAPAALDYVCAASLLLRRSALEQIGLLDPRYFLYWEDTDLSFRLRASGLRWDVVENSRVLHRESAASGGHGSRVAYRYYVRSARRFFASHARMPVIPSTTRLVGGLLKWGALGDWRRVGAIWDAYRRPLEVDTASSGYRPVEEPHDLIEGSRPEPAAVQQVCVLIPVHDGVRFIRSAIDSVLEQDHANVVLRVIDNASTDGTRELVRSIADPRLELICYDDLVPVASSWARALQHATGTYVLLLAADDWLLPGALSTLVGAANENPTAAMAFGRTRYVAEGRPPVLLDRPYRPPPVGVIPNLERYVLEHGYNVAIGATLFRTGTPGLRIDPQSRNACDMDLLLRVGRHGGSAIGVDRLVVSLREHAGALSSDRVKMAEVTLDTLDMHKPDAPEPWLYERRSQRVLLWAVVRLLGAGERGRAAELVERYASHCRPAWRSYLRALVRFPCLRWLPIGIRRAATAIRRPAVTTGEA